MHFFMYKKLYFWYFLIGFKFLRRCYPLKKIKMSTLNYFLKKGYSAPFCVFLLIQTLTLSI